MLPRSLRISPRDFSRRKANQTLSTRSLSVKVYAGSLNVCRFVIIIGQSVFRKSTERHLWKRRISGLAETLVVPGKDLVIIAKPELATMSRKGLAGEFRHALGMISNTHNKK